MDGYTGTDDDEGRGGNECVGNRVLDRRLTVHESICHWYVHHIQSQIKARAGINIWGFGPKKERDVCKGVSRVHACTGDLSAV